MLRDRFVLLSAAAWLSACQASNSENDAYSAKNEPQEVVSYSWLCAPASASTQEQNGGTANPGDTNNGDPTTTGSPAAEFRCPPATPACRPAHQAATQASQPGTLSFVCQQTGEGPASQTSSGNGNSGAPPAAAQGGFCFLNADSSKDGAQCKQGLSCQALPSGALTLNTTPYTEQIRQWISQRTTQSAGSGGTATPTSLSPDEIVAKIGACAPAPAENASATHNAAAPRACTDNASCTESGQVCRPGQWQIGTTELPRACVSPRTTPFDGKGWCDLNPSDESGANAKKDCGQGLVCVNPKGENQAPPTSSWGLAQGSPARPYGVCRPAPTN